MWRDRPQAEMVLIDLIQGPLCPLPCLQGATAAIAAYIQQPGCRRQAGPLLLPALCLLASPALGGLPLPCLPCCFLRPPLPGRPGAALLHPPPHTPVPSRCALLAHFGDKRTRGCQEVQGEQRCDYCVDPQAVRSCLRRQEARVEAAAEADAATAVAARGGGSWGQGWADTYSVGSGGEGGQQQQGGSGSNGEGGEDEGEGATAAAPRPDPFCTAGALPTMPVQGPGPSRAGRPGPGMGRKQLGMRPRPAAAGAAAAASTAGGAGASGGSPSPVQAQQAAAELEAGAAGLVPAAGRVPGGGLRKPLKPLLPNHSVKRPFAAVAEADGKSPQKAFAGPSHAVAAAAAEAPGCAAQPDRAISAAAAAPAQPAPLRRPVLGAPRRAFKPPRMARPRSPSPASPNEQWGLARPRSEQ